MEIKAVQKFVRTSPQKLRLVTDMIKGLSPTEALERLPFAKKRAAKPLLKAIKVAMANAKDQGVSGTDLIFKEIQINEGPKLKRGRPVSRGRWHPYKRRMSHIRIVLETKEPEPIKEARKKIKAEKESEKGVSKERRFGRAKSLIGIKSKKEAKSSLKKK